MWLYNFTESHIEVILEVPNTQQRVKLFFKVVYYIHIHKKTNKCTTPAITNSYE